MHSIILRKQYLGDRMKYNLNFTECIIYKAIQRNLNIYRSIQTYYCWGKMNQVRNYLSFMSNGISKYYLQQKKILCGKKTQAKMYNKEYKIIQQLVYILI